MTTIKTIYLFVVLLPSVIYGKYEDSPFEDILLEIDHMAENGQNINGVFQPAPDGYLGEGDFGFAYKGLFIPTNMAVAMKFTPTEEQFEAAKEYAIYKYLNALNNTFVEQFGIPSVHYFGLWDDYVLLAITLLDADCLKKAHNDEINELDVIIMFREFVRITKYIHGCGIRHEDIKLDNLMFRRHAGFIIDFNSATKMYGRRREENLNLLESHANEDGAKYAKMDWKCFFVSMFDLICSNVDWFGAGATKLMRDRQNIEPETKADIINIMKTIEKINHSGLRIVFSEFAKHILLPKYKHLSRDENGVPFYDQVYHVISAEIRKFCPFRLGIVSWLTGHDQSLAIYEMQAQPIPPIEALNDPFGDEEPRYSRVDYDFFYNMYHNQGSGRMFARSESFGQTRRKMLRVLHV